MSENLYLQSNSEQSNGESHASRDIDILLQGKLLEIQKMLHLCTFKTPIIYTFSLDFYGFYSLEYTFLSYYKHLL